MKRLCKLLFGFIYRKIISYLPAKVNCDRIAVRQLNQEGDTKWQ